MVLQSLEMNATYECYICTTLNSAVVRASESWSSLEKRKPVSVESKLHLHSLYLDRQIHVSVAQ